MSLKTEYCYNEDNFIQEDENNLKELTVTITLCEYRNLIKEITYQDGVIEKLQEENKKLKGENKAYADYVVHKNPDIIKQMTDTVGAIFGITHQEETEQPEEETEETTE